MKYILEIIGKLHIGGAEKVAYEIGMNRNKEKWTVHYVVFGDEIGEYEPILEENGCKIFHIPSPSDSYSLFLKNIESIVKKYKYSVIHAHTMFNSGWAMYIGKKYNIPVRITHSHSKRDPGKATIQKRLYNLLMRLFIRLYSTNFVGCGEKAGEFMFGKSFFKKNGIVLVNGIDTSKFLFNKDKRFEIRKKLNLENNFVIGHVGRLSNVKNQSFLIKIMPEILKIKDNAKLVLIGNGEDREKLENLVKENNLEGKVIFLGSILDVHNYINIFDVFAFPSLNEGTPLSLIENQANGLPCVISDQIPNDTFITDLIKVVPLNNKEKWVSEICSKERNKSELYGSIVNKSGFDLHNMIEKLYSIFEGK